jgi:broad specificity phosphatase PhoE
MNRVRHTLNQLKKSQGFVVVFSHSTFTKALLWQVLAAPSSIDASAMRHFHWFHRGFRIPNASILELEFINDRSIHWSNIHVDHIPEHLQTPKLERAIELQLADQPS